MVAIKDHKSCKYSKISSWSLQHHSIWSTCSKKISSKSRRRQFRQIPKKKTWKTCVWLIWLNKSCPGAYTWIQAAVVFTGSTVLIFPSFEWQAILESKREVRLRTRSRMKRIKYLPHSWYRIYVKKQPQGLQLGGWELCWLVFQSRPGTFS